MQKVLAIQEADYGYDRPRESHGLDRECVICGNHVSIYNKYPACFHHHNKYFRLLHEQRKNKSNRWQSDYYKRTQKKKV